MAFSPDGRTLVSGTEDGDIKLWPTFPWREEDYPGSPSMPLAERIERYKRKFWREKLSQLDAFVVAASKNKSDFDYVYIAPPQYKGMWEKAVLQVDNNKELLVEDGWIVVQIAPTEYKELELANFSVFDKRKYGNTLLVFYERNP